LKEGAREKTYLGDGVYVEESPYPYPGRFVLTTENGVAVTNEIVLESEVVRAFDEWRKR
jgi:hypothetical protein